MITFAHSWAHFALLAIVVGLRLAAYVYERMTAPIPANQPLAEPPMPLAPDAPIDVPASPDAVTADPPSPATRLPQMLYELLDSSIVALVLIVFIINPFIVQAFVIPSGSMNNTLMQGDKLIATKYSYVLTAPHRGDVVVFHAPPVALELLGQQYNQKDPVEYVKRVVAVPGDRVHILAGDGVYVNGARLHESYARSLPNYDFPVNITGDVTVNGRVRSALFPHIEGRELVVPQGYVLVLGDNRNQSHDGHVWGLLPRKNIVGKATFIFWPPPRLSFIR